jgi:hypothetical protein
LGNVDFKRTDVEQVVRKNECVWRRDSCGLRVSGKVQCEHEVVGTIRGNDYGLTGALYMYIVFSFQLGVESRPVFNV